jgi:hypothetical protein
MTSMQQPQNTGISRYERWKVRHRLKGCLINVTRLVFTLLLLLLAVGYAFSIIVLDINMVLILVLIVLIWFTPTIVRYFENIQFKREGDKLEFSLAFAKLRDIEEKAEEASLLQTPQNLSDVERFVQISKINPNAALIALRTDIERKLQQIAQAAQIDTSAIRMQSMGELLRILERERLLNREEVAVLHELRNTLNQVAHSVDVSPDVIQWAVNTGPFILTALDKKLTDIQSKK